MYNRNQLNSRMTPHNMNYHQSPSYPQSNNEYSIQHKQMNRNNFDPNYYKNQINSKFPSFQPIDKNTQGAYRKNEYFQDNKPTKRIINQQILNNSQENQKTKNLKDQKMLYQQHIQNLNNDSYHSKFTIFKGKPQERQNFNYQPYSIPNKVNNYSNYSPPLSNNLTKFGNYQYNPRNQQNNILYEPQKQEIKYDGYRYNNIGKNHERNYSNDLNSNRSFYQNNSHENYKNENYSNLPHFVHYQPYQQSDSVDSRKNIPENHFYPVNNQYQSFNNNIGFLHQNSLPQFQHYDKSYEESLNISHFNTNYQPMNQKQQNFVNYQFQNVSFDGSQENKQTINMLIEQLSDVNYKTKIILEKYHHPNDRLTRTYQNNRIAFISKQFQAQQIQQIQQFMNFKQIIQLNFPIYYPTVKLQPNNIYKLNFCLLIDYEYEYKKLNLMLEEHQKMYELFDKMKKQQQMTNHQQSKQFFEDEQNYNYNAQYVDININNYQNNYNQFSNQHQQPIALNIKTKNIPPPPFTPLTTFTSLLNQIKQYYIHLFKLNQIVKRNKYNQNIIRNCSDEKRIIDAAESEEIFIRLLNIIKINLILRSRKNNSQTNNSSEKIDQVLINDFQQLQNHLSDINQKLSTKSNNKQLISLQKFINLIINKKFLQKAVKNVGSNQDLDQDIQKNYSFLQKIIELIIKYIMQIDEKIVTEKDIKITFNNIFSLLQRFLEISQRENSQQSKFNDQQTESLSVVILLKSLIKQGICAKIKDFLTRSSKRSESESDTQKRVLIDGIINIIVFYLGYLEQTKPKQRLTKLQQQIQQIQSLKLFLFVRQMLDLLDISHQIDNADYCSGILTPETIFQRIMSLCVQKKQKKGRSHSFMQVLQVKPGKIPIQTGRMRYKQQQQDNGLCMYEQGQYMN